MKRKYIAMLLGATMSVSMIQAGTVFAEQSIVSEVDTEETEQEDAVYGEVTEIADGQITLDIGTLSEGGSEEAGAPGSNVSIEKTGETLTVEVTEDTEIKQNRGMGGGMPGGDAPNGEVPEKPEGEAANGEAPEKPEGEAPNSEAPNGEAPNGEAPDMPGGSEQVLTIENIQVGDIVAITMNEDGSAASITLQTANGGPEGMGMPGGNGGPGANTSEVIYGGATEITSTASEEGQTYTSETADESALLVSTSEDVTITDATVTKTGDSDGGDNCNFYGQNAALLVKDGSTTQITGATITSEANGANGVFSYGGNGGQNGADGDGTTVIISDSTITTTGDGAGGIMTAGGGVTEASNLTVTTSGQSSAAIRSDRGGGTVTVDGGTYTTNGLGSPSIYSTADITVDNATLVSNLSEGVCIEGLNSITLNDSDLTANNTDLNGNATFYDTIMIYQSMSGDSASGTSTFTMNGGSLTSENGHLIHVTNTDAIINLTGVDITNNDEDNILLSVCDDGWSGGSNIAELYASQQQLDGAVLVGDNSTLTMELSDGSSFTGYIGGEIVNASGETVSTEVGTVSVTLDESSTWTLTEDSYITEFTGDVSNIISNGYTLYVDGVSVN